LDYMVWLSIHEMTHVLGFNNGLYEDWVDNDFNAYGVDNVLGKGNRNGKAYTYIKTPKVLEKSRTHFNCENLEGVPLEYNGGEGTAGAHWSKRYMNTDYMIGDSYGENLISEITLAMFEDSGWYIVNYDYANMFIWGKNKGCEFFEGKCIEKDKAGEYATKFVDEFCTDFNLPVCSASYVFRGNCATQIHPKLSKHSRYFTNPKEGGVDPLTDYCPIPIEEKENQVYYGGSCRVGDNKSIQKFEKVCPECACFMSSLKEQKEKVFRFSERTVSTRYTLQSPPVALDLRAACHEFFCEGSELMVKVGETKVACQEKETKVPGYDGFILCPPSDVICHPKYKCKYGCTEKYDNSRGFFNFNFRSSLS